MRRVSRTLPLPRPGAAVRSALLAPVLALLLLATGPGLTLYLHSCRIRGTEVTLARPSACCWAQRPDAAAQPTLHRTTCCDEHVAQLGAPLTYSISAAPSVPVPVLLTLALPPAAPRATAAVQARVAHGRGPPAALAPSGRERRIAQASFLI